MIAQHDNLVLVGLPDGARDPTIQIINGVWEFVYSSGPNGCHSIKLPAGKYTLIGLHSEEQPLSEDKLREVVEVSHWVTTDTTTYWYKNYSGEGSRNTATESFASLLSHVGMYTKNPFADIITGKRPERMVPFMGPGMYTDRDKKAIELWREQCKKYDEAQSRTFKKIAVLKRIA